MKDNLKKIDLLCKKQLEIQKEINILTKPIEEDLYFSVIEITNKINNISHIINGVSFELFGEKNKIFSLSFTNNKYHLSEGMIHSVFNTKEEMFEYFYTLLKEKFPQIMRELKLKRIIDE